MGQSSTHNSVNSNPGSRRSADIWRWKSKWCATSAPHSLRCITSALECVVHLLTLPHAYSVRWSPRKPPRTASGAATSILAFDFFFGFFFSWGGLECLGWHGAQRATPHLTLPHFLFGTVLPLGWLFFFPVLKLDFEAFSWSHSSTSMPLTVVAALSPINYQHIAHKWELQVIPRGGEWYTPWYTPWWHTIISDGRVHTKGVVRQHPLVRSNLRRFSRLRSRRFWEGFLGVLQRVLEGTRVLRGFLEGVLRRGFREGRNMPFQEYYPLRMHPTQRVNTVHTTDTIRGVSSYFSRGIADTGRRNSPCVRLVQSFGFTKKITVWKDQKWLMLHTNSFACLTLRSCRSTIAPSSPWYLSRTQSATSSIIANLPCAKAQRDGEILRKINKKRDRRKEEGLQPAITNQTDVLCLGLTKDKKTQGGNQTCQQQYAYLEL